MSDLPTLIAKKSVSSFFFQNMFLLFVDLNASVDFLLSPPRLPTVHPSSHVQTPTEFNLPPIAEPTATLTVTGSGSGSGSADDDDNTNQEEAAAVALTPTTITIQAPLITTVASNVQVECDATFNVADKQRFLDAHGNSLAVGTCGNHFAWSTIGSPPSSFSCPLTTKYTFVATDACGNAASTAASFSVVDTAPPYFTTSAQTVRRECSSGVVNVDAVRDYIAVAGGAVAEDACRWAEGTEGQPAVLQWEYPDVPTNVNLLQQCKKVVSFSFGVRDTCGLFAQSVGELIFVDTAAPIITRQPAAETRVKRASYSASVLRDWVNSHGGAEADDACDHGTTWSYAGEPILPELAFSGCESDLKLVFSVTDDCGNTAYTAPARFIVEDSEPPLLIDVEDETVECASNGNVGHVRNFLAKTGTCSDAGGGSTIRDFVQPANGWTQLGGNGCAEQAYTAAFTCTDVCGLTTSETASLFVADTMPPILRLDKATAFVYYCDGRCVSSFWKEKANARSLFESWLHEEHGCLGGIDRCSSVSWKYTVTHDDRSFVDMNELCGSSGTVEFTATDACGNAAVGTLKYSFPEILPSVLTLPAAAPDFNLINKNLVHNAATPCYLCKFSDGTGIFRRFKRLIFRWEGASSVEVALGSNDAAASVTTLGWGSQFVLTTETNFKALTNVTVTALWEGQAVTVAVEFGRKCAESPGPFIGERTKFGSVGVLILVGFESMGGATELECPGGMPAPTFAVPPYGTVSERGCCYSFSTRSGTLWRYGYVGKAAGEMCAEFNEAGTAGMEGQRFAPGVACTQLASGPDAWLPVPAPLAAAVAEPASCTRQIAHVNVCVPGVEPYDVASPPDLTAIIDDTAGCCFTQRISLENGVIIGEDHVDTNLGKCDTTILGREFTPSVPCLALKATLDATSDTTGCCYARIVALSGQYVYAGHVASIAKDCSVSSSKTQTMIGFSPTACADTIKAQGAVAGSGAASQQSWDNNAAGNTKKVVEMVIVSEKNNYMEADASSRSAGVGASPRTTATAATPTSSTFGGIVGACVALIVAIMVVVVATNRRYSNNKLEMESFIIENDNQMIIQAMENATTIEGDNIAGDDAVDDDADNGITDDGLFGAGRSVMRPDGGGGGTQWMQSLPADYLDLEVDEEDGDDVIKTNSRGRNKNVNKLLAHRNTVAVPTISLDTAMVLAKSKLVARAISAPSRMESEFI